MLIHEIATKQTTSPLSLPDCIDETHQLEVSPSNLLRKFHSVEKKTHSRSNSYSGQPCRHMRTTDQRCIIFVFQLKLPHCAQERGPSIACHPCNCSCQPSVSFIASRRYFTSLLSRSGTPRVELCVVWPRGLSTARPRERMLSFTWASALPCSLEKRLVLSLCVDKLSCISEALQLISFVRCSAFFASAQIAS